MVQHPFQAMQKQRGGGPTRMQRMQLGSRECKPASNAAPRRLLLPGLPFGTWRRAPRGRQRRSSPGCQSTWLSLYRWRGAPTAPPRPPAAPALSLASPALTLLPARASSSWLSPVVVWRWLRPLLGSAAPPAAPLVVAGRAPCSTSKLARLPSSSSGGPELPPAAAGGLIAAVPPLRALRDGPSSWHTAASARSGPLRVHAGHR